MNDFVEVVILARENRDWSQKDLARSAGVASSCISRFENGENVQMYTLEKIADALGYQLIMIPKGIKILPMEEPKKIKLSPQSVQKPVKRPFWTRLLNVFSS